MARPEANWKDKDYRTDPEDIRDVLEDLRAAGEQYVKGRDVAEHLSDVGSSREITQQMRIAELEGWWEEWAGSSKASTYRILVGGSDE